MNSALTHIVIIACIVLLLVLCIGYPFMPGEFDPLALPISIIAQAVGVIGLPLSLIGLLWLLMPKTRFLLAIISLIAGCFVLLVASLIATLSVGKSVGIIMLAAGILFIFYLIRRIRHIKANPVKSSVVALYLITIPVSILIVQLVMTKPLTQWSRSRAMDNAGEYISEIENYHAKYGRYPVGLQAQHKDYQPGIAGIERYHYLAAGNSYNLSFEQPRFFFDDFGTREWVVYNPHNQHQWYSHTAWMLLDTTNKMNSTQGWYGSGETGRPHWKYFLFD